VYPSSPKTLGALPLCASCARRVGTTLSILWDFPVPRQNLSGDSEKARTISAISHFLVGGCPNVVIRRPIRERDGVATIQIRFIDSVVFQI
jgi:hypothetical protein